MLLKSYQNLRTDVHSSPIQADARLTWILVSYLTFMSLIARCIQSAIPPVKSSSDIPAFSLPQILVLLQNDWLAADCYVAHLSIDFIPVLAAVRIDLMFGKNASAAVHPTFLKYPSSTISRVRRLDPKMHFVLEQI
jgi:hypothetical protein